MERQLKITHFVLASQACTYMEKCGAVLMLTNCASLRWLKKSQLAVGFNCFSYRFKKINPNSVTWHPFAGEAAHHNS